MWIDLKNKNTQNSKVLHNSQAGGASLSNSFPSIFNKTPMFVSYRQKLFLNFRVFMVIFDQFQRMKFNTTQQFMNPNFTYKS